MHDLYEPVSGIIRAVSAEIVIPYFRHLADDQILEKDTDDLVTVADHLAETALRNGLLGMTPSAHFVGEEGTEANPAQLDRVGDDLVWIVDPIDGTGNYAAGHSPFAIMVALARHGIVEAGWIYDPVADRMLHAVRDRGAYVDRERIVAHAAASPVPVLALGTRFLPSDLCADLTARAVGRMNLVPTPMCAGEQYARLALGQDDVAIFWRTYPWDHAAGGLILEEAGGKLAYFDGSPYQIEGKRHGLIATATPSLLRIALAELTPDSSTITSIDQ